MSLVRKLNTVFLQLLTLSAFSLTESRPAQWGDDKTKTHWLHCEVPFLLISPIPHPLHCDTERLWGRDDWQRLLSLVVLSCPTWDIRVTRPTMFLILLPGLIRVHLLILFLQVQDKFRLDLNDEEAVQFLQSLIDESVSAMFPVVVEQIHKFAQVNQSYIKIYNLWFFHWRFIWFNVQCKIIIRSVLYDNKLGFSSLCPKKTWLWTSVADFEKLFFIEKTFIILVSLHNRTTEKTGRQNACVWQPWQAYYLCVLWWSSLKSMLSGLLQKDLFKGGWSSPENFFSCHACHTRFAIFLPLPSCRISALLAECCCISTTIIPLCTLPVVPFIHLRKTLQ